MQTNDSMARFFSQTADSIAQINKEPNIDANGKNALVQNQLDLLKNYMTVAGAISNMPDLPGLLIFDGTSLVSRPPTAPAAPISTPQTEALQILGRLTLQAEEGGDSWVDPVTGQHYSRDQYQQLQAKAGG